jgi:hypothetical protein
MNTQLILSYKEEETSNVLKYIVYGNTKKNLVKVEKQLL